MDNLPQALKELAEIADELNIGKHCGCWVVKEGEYWKVAYSARGDVA